ncbi:hypothetical protein TIFTF001_034572 [Ficus carica]|uniref:Uncharacterized protein n=1 Tax=Ficus carica TaxID=3494 RepID=A0AA88J5B5_FICCA|nr:hypothetical protein TIFTF001_034572 [Ficus carica]
MSDRVAEQRDRLKDLQEKDIARGEKLLDIERKFGDVKAGAEGLMSELQKSMDVAREGTSAMETLVKRFDEGQARIKSLEAENAALATQIIKLDSSTKLKSMKKSRCSRRIILTKSGVYQLFLRQRRWRLRM